MRQFILFLLVITSLGLGSAWAQDPTAEPTTEPTAEAETEVVTLDEATLEATYYVAFNRFLREEVGALPLARNPILDEVAGRIAEQVGCTEDRVEFDIQRDVQRRGYATFPNDNEVRTTRFPLLPIVNLRPVEEMAEFYTQDIYDNNINQPGRFYREIGIGVVPCRAVVGIREGSTDQYGLFVILGAQPNVIPVVIENGESELPVASVPATVTLSIHQENSRPREGIFGDVATVRLSNAPLEDSDTPQRYSKTLEWEFETCGTNTLYYELTDTEGVVVTGETSIELVCEN